MGAGDGLSPAQHHVIERTSPDRLVDIVREMVGIHAQVASSAELQLAARIDGLRPADVQDALATQRSLVKAWSMRGTLHLLVPEDLARIVVASGTRERWREAPWQKAYEVTFEQVEAMIAAVGDTLSDEPMLRADVADAVAAHLSDPALATKLRSGLGLVPGACRPTRAVVLRPAGGTERHVRPPECLAAPPDRP